MRQDLQTTTVSRPRALSRTLWSTALGLVWLGAVIAGLGLLARYDNQPGEAAHASSGWPAESRISRDPGRPTLVMLAHPRCTCTRASLTELTEVMTRAAARPRAYVVFIKPGGVADDWEMTDLWQTASRIPDVTVLRDDEGIEARRFGAATSGQTFLYAPDGRLLFSGGTTGSRGHVGDNMGRATILAILNHEHPMTTATVAAAATVTAAAVADLSGQAASPVFGCPLFALHPDREVEPHDARPSVEARPHGTHRN